MATNNFSETILTEASFLLRPLLYLDTDKKLQSFFENIGYQLPDSDVGDLFASIVSNADTIVHDVEDLLTSTSFADRTITITHLINSIKGTVDAIGDLESAIRSSSVISAAFRNNALLNDLPKRVLDFLVFTDLNNEYPKIFGILYLLGVIDEIELAKDDSIFQSECKLKIIYWEKMPRFLSEPGSLIEEMYRWSTNFDHGKFFDRFNVFLNALAIPGGLYLQSDGIKTVLGNTSSNLSEIKVAVLSTGIHPSSYAQFGLDLTPVEAKAGKKAGLAVIPYLIGTSEFDFEIDENWQAVFDSSLDIAPGIGIIIRPSFSMEVIESIFSRPADAASLQLSFTAKQSDTEDSEFSEIFVFGDENSDHISLKDISISFFASVSPSAHDAGVEITIGTLKMLLSTADSDNFIKKILSPGQIDSTFATSIKVSLSDGITFKGSSNLQISVPVHIELGPVEISNMLLLIEPEAEKLAAEVTASIDAELGPLKIIIENIGLRSDIAFPSDRRGNLGLIDAKLSFNPPSLITVSIDSNGFVGGGFLYLDEEKKEYSGGLEIEFRATISIKAIGLLSTLMPDGSDGYSFLIIITAEFTPIQLGFGFTLNGVGGLIGINRTCEVDVLQSGVKDGSLDNILFPQDIVTNASQIVTDVKKVFPVYDGQYVFGPMVELGWGTPTLITVQMGLLIEIPDPVRIAILGVLKALLPDEDFKLLSLQVNFLGVIDFESCSLSFDASIYDSRLLSYTLSGDMALRLNWGTDPVFLLSVGGFHPAYDPPTNLGVSNMERLAIDLFPTNNPRLRIDSYFAVTSNSVQFGASGQLFVSVSSFDVEGNVGFDVLFQFSPFYFVAKCNANLSVSAFEEEILSIDLSLKLDGPTPWHAKGKASFKVVFKVEVNINESFGDEENTALEPVNVKSLVLQEFAKKNNWTSKMPDDNNLQVVLRTIEINDDLIITQPCGILAVSQKLVPMKITISKFGNQAVSGDDHFSISGVNIGTEPVSFNCTEEEFAPAQFFEMSDSEKLSDNDFEDYNSGISIDGSGQRKADYVSARDVEYELQYLHRERISKSIKPVAELFNKMLKSSATSKSKLSAAASSPSALGTRKVLVPKEQFTIAHVSNMKLYEDNIFFNSKREAKVRLGSIINKHPSLKSDLQVVPAYEVTV